MRRKLGLLVMEEPGDVDLVKDMLEVRLAWEKSTNHDILRRILKEHISNPFNAHTHSKSGPKHL